MKPDGAARRTVLRTAASLSLGAVVLLAAAAAEALLRRRAE